VFFKLNHLLLHIPAVVASSKIAAFMQIGLYLSRLHSYHGIAENDL